MWTTTQAGIDEMLNAAGSAVVGSRREDALDAANAWIGAAIRLKLIQTVGGNDVTVHERTHASGMTRTGEELIAPNTSWTIVSHQAFSQADGPLRVRIEKSSDSTRFFEYEIGPGEAGSLSDDMADNDTLSLIVKITATNIVDFGEAPEPPDEYDYLIYDNPAAPIDVSAAMVGMHFTNAANIAAPGYDYDTFRTFDCPPLRWSNIETSDNTFSWTAADAAIDAAYNAGKRIVFVVSNPPAFHVSTGPYPDGNWPALDRFVDEIMTRYAGKLWAVQWWSNPNRAAQLAEFAQGQVRTYRRVKAADPSVLVFLGGFRTSGDSVDAADDVIAMGLTVYDGTQARNAADVLGFQSFGTTPAITHALAKFRSLEATRNTLRPALQIAMDMCGGDATAGAGFSEAEHIQVIQQLLLLGVGFRALMVGLYAHERSQEIGNPSGSATVRAAIDAIHDGVAGKRLVRAYALSDGTVWIAFYDGTTLQSPGGTYVPPVDPDPDRDLRMFPYRVDSAWNTKIPPSAIWRGTSDPRTARIRSTQGGGNHYDTPPGSIVWAMNLWDYTIATWYASSSDPWVTINQGGQSWQVRCPANAVPSSGTDRHMCIVDPDGLHSHDMWGATRSGNVINAWSYVKTRLDGAGWRMVEESLESPSNPRGLNLQNASAGGGGPRAVSAGSLGGLIRKADLDAGVIAHALVFATPRRWCNGAFGVRVHPANWISDGDGDDSSGTWEAFSGDIRYSDRFGLDKNVDVNSLGLSAHWTMIAKALQDYGMYMGDVAGVNNPCLYAEWPAIRDAYGDGLKNQQGAGFAAIIPHMMALDWYP